MLLWMQCCERLMLRDEIAERLLKMGQKELIASIDLLNAEQKQHLLVQLSRFPNDLLARQREVLFCPQKKVSSVLPLEEAARSGNEANKQVGEKLLSEGKIGCIILAGGQGSRLGHGDPKGTFSVTNIKKKSLFQLFLEKTIAASKLAGCKLSLAIMTSPVNHEETQEFLRRHDWFGLSSDELQLFCQKMLPLLDERGNWVLDPRGKILEGPDGNGNVFQLFCETGLFQKWKERGIQYAQVILIDNSLADPFDRDLCGFHHKSGAEVTIKAIERADPLEPLGVITKIDKEKVRIVEYSELSDRERSTRTEEGKLLFPFANTSMFCFSLSFVQKLMQQSLYTLPWHMAKKTAHGSNVWKCETFIFDLLDYAGHIEVMVFPREEVFAPLKTISGREGISSVREALLHFDRRVFERISGIETKDRCFELDPHFYYPTQELLLKWKGRPLPSEDYIEP